MTYLTHYLAAAFGLGLGWFLALTMAANSLRDDADQLREREEALDDAHRILGARLLSTHIQHSTLGHREIRN